MKKGRALNAVSSGLYSKSPSQRVKLPALVSVASLAPYAGTMADAAIWIAEGLASIRDDRARILVGLYASVAHELYQLQGELAGATGVKPSPLGQLDRDAYEAMMANQARAVELVLSQVASAMKRLRDVEEIEGEGLWQGDQKKAAHDADQEDKLLLWLTFGEEGAPNPVLEYLAGHMRAAKRMLRDMAANKAWEQAREAQTNDLAARLLNAIRKED